MYYFKTENIIFFQYFQKIIGVYFCTLVIQYVCTNICSSCPRIFIVTHIKELFLSLCPQKVKVNINDIIRYFGNLLNKVFINTRTYKRNILEVECICNQVKMHHICVGPRILMDNENMFTALNVSVY